ncbi:MAG: ribosomal-processing cysteine protease Prp [Spirochaetes bacterium]|nr:ribosomal-processing cysteine protease Prp [Spirochaetota bacterium]
MIKIDIWLLENGIFQSFQVQGHAGYADKGKDIVCSAVSVLVQTVYLSLQAVPDCQIEYQDDNKVKCRLLDYQSQYEQEIKGISFFFLNGLKLISSKYGQYVKLKIIGENDGTS